MTKPVDVRVEEAARRLWDAGVARMPCAPVRDLIGTDDAACAYAVQQRNIARRMQTGARPVGRKIGMTSAAVQEQLGYDQPNYGTLFDDREVPDGEGAPAIRLLQPRAEAEVAFVLGRNLDQEFLTLSQVIRAVDYAVGAIEIVDSRITNWDIRATDSIADNASCGMYVLGQRPRRITDVDLALCGMVSRLNGRIASVGVGGACMGNPLVALLWLARTVLALGQPLQEGDLVLTGALGPMVPIVRGDLFEAEIAGFGSVRVVLSDGDADSAGT
jgi:2-keto-4-pentenoate hydratase